MTRIAVYTSVFGGFEKVWPPAWTDPNHEYFLVTDSATTVDGWSLRVRNQELAGSENPRLANRSVKMLFHEGLSDFDFSIYLDANVRMASSIQPLVDFFAESGADIGLYPHYARHSVETEVNACLARAKVTDQPQLRAELDFYRAAGFPDASGMWEGSVILKNHRSPRISPAMNEWWRLYRTHQSRDQFSLPFVIWEHGLTVCNLDNAPKNRSEHFIRLQHSTRGLRNTLARYIHARSIEGPAWALLYKAAQWLFSSHR